MFSECEPVNLGLSNVAFHNFVICCRALERQESDEYLSTLIKIKFSSLYLVNCHIHEEQWITSETGENMKMVAR